MGSGKTTYGLSLAKELGLPFIDLDDFIQEKYSNTIAELFNSHGEAEFRQMEYYSLLQITQAHTEAVIATGGGTVVKQENRDLISQTALKTIYLNYEVDTLVQRLLNTDLSTRPLIANLNQAELIDTLTTLNQLREQYYLELADEIIS